MSPENRSRDQITANLSSIEQTIALLDRLSDAQYRNVATDLSNSCVGGHVRHIIDFYRCLLSGLDNGVIDYDNRQRAGIIECERSAASRALQTIHQQLAKLNIDAAAPIYVRNQLFCDSVNEPESSSTIGRELVFLHSHTTHHFALIAFLLRAQGVAVPADFGLNPATVKHARELAGNC